MTNKKSMELVLDGTGLLFPLGSPTKQMIPSEKLKAGSLKGKFPVKLDERTTVFTSDPSPENVARIRTRLEQRHSTNHIPKPPSCQKTS
jgi:hypothetical protein